MSEDALAERMRRLGIRDVDLQETFARSRGPGGQNVNKASTAVTLRHRTSGISVTVQDSRSQAQNCRLARYRELRATEHGRRGVPPAPTHANERERRRKAPRTTRLERRILDS